jgi:hypothetical protein
MLQRTRSREVRRARQADADNHSGIIGQCSRLTKKFLLHWALMVTSPRLMQQHSITGAVFVPVGSTISWADLGETGPLSQGFKRVGRHSEYAI